MTNALLKLRRKKFIKITLSIFVIGYLAYFIIKDFGELKSSIDFSFVEFITISILHLSFLMVNAKRFLIVVNLNERPIKYHEWFAWFIEARILNKLFPQLGNIYRGVQLKEKYGISYSSYSASYIFFSWIDTILNFSAAFAAMLYVSNYRDIDNNLTYFIGIILLGLAAAPLFLEALPAGERISRMRLGGLIISLLVRLRSLLINFVKNKVVYELIFLGVISFVFMAARIGFGFAVFGINIAIPDLFILYAFYKLSIMIVLTPGNIGIQELSIASIGSLLGYDFTVGIAVSLLLRVYGYILFFSLWLYFNFSKIFKNRLKL